MTCDNCFTSVVLTLYASWSHSRSSSTDKPKCLQLLNSLLMEQPVLNVYLSCSFSVFLCLLKAASSRFVVLSLGRSKLCSLLLIMAFQYLMGVFLGELVCDICPRTPTYSKASQNWHRRLSLAFVGLIILVTTNRTPDAELLTYNYRYRRLNSCSIG